jgi:hypothetical protein
MLVPESDFSSAKVAWLQLHSGWANTTIWARPMARATLVRAGQCAGALDGDPGVPSNLNNAMAPSTVAIVAIPPNASIIKDFAFMQAISAGNGESFRRFTNPDRFPPQLH